MKNTETEKKEFYLKFNGKIISPFDAINLQPKVYEVWSVNNVYMWNQEIISVTKEGNRRLVCTITNGKQLDFYI